MFDIATPDRLDEYRMTHPVEAMERMQHGDRECTVVWSKVDHTASYGGGEEGLPFFIGLGSVQPIVDRLFGDKDDLLIQAWDIQSCRKVVIDVG